MDDIDNKFERQALPEERPVTIADLAVRAGVSPMTVSKALRDTGRLSAGTRARIKLLADELGYVPNSLAGALSSRTSKLVAVLIPSISDHVYAEVLGGIHGVLRPEGLQTFIGETFFDPELEESLLRTMLSLKPAGLLVSGGIQRTEKARVLLERRQVPAVQMWDQRNAGLDAAVGVDHAGAGRMAARRLLDAGLRRLAYVGSQLEADLCARERFKGFAAEVSAAGARLTVLDGGTLPRQVESGNLLVQQLLGSVPDVEGIHFLNDAMAAGGLRYLFEAGIDVPGQVSVIGFNGTAHAFSIRTRLTTLDLPRLQLGRDAACCLLQLCRRSAPGPGQEIGLRIIEGNTTRPLLPDWGRERAVAESAS